MTFSIVPYASRQEWLDLRRSGLGASDIAAIMGVSPWSTARQVWISKVEPDAPEPMSDEDMEWGLRMEDLILTETFDRLACGEVLRGQLIRSDEQDWMMATPDGLDTQQQLVVEVKKVDEWSWDEIPTHYYHQVQWQLAVAGYQKGWIAALHRGRRLEPYPVERDEEVIAKLVEAGERFWVEYVIPREPPPVEAGDNDYLGLLWPDSVDRAVEVPPELARELVAAKAAAKAAEGVLKDVSARVKDLLGEADTAVCGQQVLATWKTSKPRSYVDLDAMRAEEPDLVATYSKKKPGSRRFLVKEME